MQAALYTQYGSPDVVHMGEAETPTPQPNQVRVRVHAASVGFGDLMARNFGNMTAKQFHMPAVLWLMARFSFGWRAPKQPILGAEFSGVIESVGSAVTRFKVGDEVFGYRGQALGAHAEYVCMAEDGLITRKPANLTHELAAALPYGALTAQSLLRKADIRHGQRVLIHGASGGIGAAAVQLAKHYGAHVTGTCSTPRLGYVRALGADEAIDYTRQDFTAGAARYDVVFDVLGKSAFSHVRRVLAPQGIYLLASFKMKQVRQMFQTRRNDQRVVCALSSETLDDLEQVRALAEAGVLCPLVDKTFPLAQAADAHRYAESGNKRGGVVLALA
jgi:NADPH:quinone reductase-like Zn-dependent oxidoreductase